MSQPQAGAVLLDHGLERPQIADADQVEQLLPRVLEMLAEMVLDIDSAFLQFGIEDLLHERCAAPAGAARFGCALQRANGGAAGGDRFAQCAFAHVVARADGCAGGKHVHTQAFRGAFTRRQNEVLRMSGERDAVQGDLEQCAVLGRVADQNRAEQRLAVARNDELLVDASDGIRVNVIQRAGGRTHRIADRCDIDAHQLEFRAHVGAGERCIGFAREMASRDFRHLITRRDESVDAPVP